MTALAGLVIVETAERVCGEYAARLLAVFGAEVIKVERPGGAPTRAMGPFHDGESTLFRYLNSNKKSVLLDLDCSGDRALLDRLLTRADALIDDHRPEWAAAHRLSLGGLPDLVHCAITPFGQAAPSHWQIARPINVMNAGGWGWHTPSETPADKPPLQGAGRFMSDYEAGIEAALCVAASLLARRRTGKGQAIDISEVAVQLSRADAVLGRMLAGDADPGPERTRYDMGGPGAAFACADGHVYLLMTTRTHWRGLCALMGDPDWAIAFPDDWLEFHCTPDRVADFRTHFRAWIAHQAKDAVSDAAQRAGVPLVQVNTAADIAHHRQYTHRGYFQSLDGIAYPTVPYRMSAPPARIHSHAPMAGAHQAEAA
ncbi:CaiB/BaiF family protein [Sphingobium indicum BiD32]|uniref:CaiB/BaiF family protein n=1 Tax=Sphingobium indicum BiD32 TaxID=1301087 RepID=N1MLV4_9SPHN|nr:CoA transferase [Sphingobium indicum]CCW16468.1 CaiB/BaiF family protein [Sphingobium indicum BiD32]